MWAHYAEQYTGAVIEFDGDHEFFDWAFDVHYSHHRPVRDWTLYANAPIPIAEMCNKSTEWEHEREVRLPRCLSDCTLSAVPHKGFPVFVLDVPPECIRRVIVGERVDQKQAREIFELIVHTEIAGDRAIVRNYNYQLELMALKVGPYGRTNMVSFAFRNYRDLPNL